MIFDLTSLGLLSISGEQAKKFLQGQLTCHVEEVTASQSRLGAHCNPQGRIISFFRLFMYGGDYYLQMPRELIPLAMQALQKYAVFFKVKLTDASNALQQIGYVGNELLDLPQHTDEQLSLDKLIIIRLPGTPARYQFMGEISAIHAFQHQLNIPTVLGNFNVWKSIDIAHKIAAIYPETSEKFLPHDLHLPQLNAVSFTKGCYTGQEIIARMQYRGKLKNHLQLVTTHMETLPIRGNDIYLEGKNSGNVVDFCQIDDNIYQLLVVTQNNCQ